jgi:hypothetical protein
MNLYITDLSKAYQQLEEKETIIYKLSGYTLDDIICRLAKGFEFVPPCKVGDKIYQTDYVKIYESTINEITYTANKKIYVTENIVFDENAIGKSIFFRRCY